MTYTPYRVWWIHNVPGEPFYVPVWTLEEAALILNTLGAYDASLPYSVCNAGGLESWAGDDEEGNHAWESWCDEKTGIDDPIQYVEQKKKVQERAGEISRDFGSYSDSEIKKVDRELARFSDELDSFYRRWYYLLERSEKAHIISGSPC